MRTTVTVAGLLLSLLAAPASALDFTTPILDQNGHAARERIKDGVYDPASPVVTLGSAISTALFAPPQADPPGARGAPADPIRLAKRAALALRLRDAKDFDLTAEQVVEIKATIAIFPPIIVLRVIEAIDPASLK